MKLPVPDHLRTLTPKQPVDVINVLRPPILLYDDFEAATLHWAKFTGAGSISRDTDLAHRGPACMKIVTAATINDRTAAHVHIGPFYEKSAVSFWMYSPDWGHTGDSDFDYIQLIFQGFWGRMINNRMVQYADIRYIPKSNKWVLYKSTGDGTIEEQEIYDYGTYGLHGGSWHFVRLIIDFPANKYVSLQCNMDTWSLSSYAPYWNSAATEGQNMLARFYAKTLAAAAKTLYIDEVMIETILP